MTFPSTVLFEKCCILIQIPLKYAHRSLINDMAASVAKLFNIEQTKIHCLKQRRPFVILTKSRWPSSLTFRVDSRFAPSQWQTALLDITWYREMCKRCNFSCWFCVITITVTDASTLAVPLQNQSNPCYTPGIDSEVQTSVHQNRGKQSLLESHCCATIALRIEPRKRFPLKDVTWCVWNLLFSGSVACESLGPESDFVTIPMTIQTSVITYRQTSNVRRTFEGNRIVYYSDVVGVSPICAFILDITSGFNKLGIDNCKTRWETTKFWNLVHLILDIYGTCDTMLYHHHWMTSLVNLFTRCEHRWWVRQNEYDCTNHFILNTNSWQMPRRN